MNQDNLVQLAELVENEEYFFDILNIIDDSLDNQGVYIENRPFRATLSFAELHVVIVENDNQKPIDVREDGHLHLKWFDFLHRRIQAWYFQKYGSDWIKNEKSINAAVLLCGVPYKFKVPLTKIVDNYDKTSTLFFCEDILDNENVLEWLYESPSLSMFSDDKKQKFEKDIKEVSTAIRKIHNSLLLTEHNEDIKRLGSIILEEIERAGDIFMKPGKYKRMHTIWDISIPCERALKVLIKNRNGVLSTGHDLPKLYENVSKYVQLDKKDLDNISKHGKQTNMRYGEWNKISMKNAFSAYRSGLRIINLATSSIKREIHFSNAKIIFKRRIYDEW